MFKGFKLVTIKLNYVSREGRLRLGVGVLSVRVGFLSLKMKVLRLESDKYKIFFVIRASKAAAYKFLCLNYGSKYMDYNPRLLA